MESFDSSIEQMLWPEKRPGNIEYVTASGKKLHGTVDVTTATSYLKVPKGYLPDLLKAGADVGSDVQWLTDALRLSHFVDEDGVAIGPIPKGTPISLLGNLDLDKRDDPLQDLLHKAQLLKLLATLKIDLKLLPKDARTRTRARPSKTRSAICLE